MYLLSGVPTKFKFSPDQKEDSYNVIRAKSNFSYLITLFLKTKSISFASCAEAIIH